MKLNAFIEGLLILKPYFDEPDGFHLGAEHDQFFVYMTNRPLSPEDFKKMKELGWFQSETSGEEYNPDDGWSAFV